MHACSAPLRGPPRGLCALALVACSSAAERTEPRPTAPAEVRPDAASQARRPAPLELAPARSAATPPDEPPAALPARLAFTLESAGRAPRASLRYAPAPGGLRYQVRASLRARTFAPTPSPAPLDVSTITERFTMAPDPARGAFTWRGHPVQIEGEDAAPYVARWRALLEGRLARLELDARGALGALTFPDEPTSTAQQDELAQRLLGYLVPLPEGAVGPDARWTVTTRLRQGSGVVEQIARYRLLARSGQTLRLAVDVRRIGDAQPLPAAGLPVGAALELVALFRAVTGEVTVRLDAPLPVGRLAIEARRHQRLRLADGSASDTITEDLGTLELSLEPATAPP